MILILLYAILTQTEPQQGQWKKPVQVDYDEDGGNWSYAMTSMGDLDDDGVRELIVGAPGSSVALFAAGAVYVYSGRTGSLIHSLYGEYTSGGLGVSVANAGDLDRDGYDDVLAGAPSADPFGFSEGAAYAYSGRTGQLLYRFHGAPTTGGRMGEAVAGVGDLNLDGWVDVAVGEPYASVIPNVGGVVWVFSGRDGSVLKQLGAPGHFGLGTELLGLQDLDGDMIPELLSTVGGAVGIFSGATGSVLREHLSLRTFSAFGEGLAEIGDLDGDEIAEYAIGAPDTGNRRGHVYLYSGATGALLHEFAGAHGGKFGASITGPGDVDGDGFPEILIGAWQENQHRGISRGGAYLFSGFDFRLMKEFEAHSFVSEDASRLS